MRRKHSGIGYEEIGATYFANALSGLVTGQETIRGQVALRNTGVNEWQLSSLSNESWR